MYTVQAEILWIVLYTVQAGILWIVYQGDALCPGTSSTCPALPCGQRCLYDFVSVNGNEIKATHTTPVARLVGVFLDRSFIDRSVEVIYLDRLIGPFIDTFEVVNYQFIVNQGFFL